jgi:hypothetical protein
MMMVILVGGTLLRGYDVDFDDACVSTHSKENEQMICYTGNRAPSPSPYLLY